MSSARQLYFEGRGKMKDLFSDNSSLYQQARPSYSAEIIEQIMLHVAENALAWDCGAGSGQFTGWLAPYFQQVLATDLSAAQLAQAPKLENVIYQTASAEESGLDDHSVDLVTVAQAIHWFDFDAFYAEVKRVLKPQGCLAVIGYGLIEASDSRLDQLIQHLYRVTLKGYWDAERRYVDECYQSIPFPFEEQSVPALQLKYSWTGQQLLDYFQTWSGLKHYVQLTGLNPLAEMAEFFQQQPQQCYEVQFPVLLRIGQ